MGNANSGNRTGNQTGRPVKYKDTRKQATIRVESELWNEFLIKARREKTTGGAIINSMIKNYMNKK